MPAPLSGVRRLPDHPGPDLPGPSDYSAFACHGGQRIWRPFHLRTSPMCYRRSDSSKRHLTSADRIGC